MFISTLPTEREGEDHRQATQEEHPLPSQEVRCQGMIAFWVLMG